ncbi:hypothetical protein HUC28_11945 [Escherichia coli]|nr:hypothetical protein [Escherichia coli]NUD80518.1 hypothetical protein [Escherichia coli]
MSTGLRFTLEVDGLPPDAFAVVSFHLNQSRSSLFFHSSVLPLHGLTGVGWSDSWSEYAWVREQGNRVDIIDLTQQ